MENLAPLLGRTLVIVAHADDEAIGCGGLLQRMREPMVLFSTDGAPGDGYFWKRYGSREAYALVRREEARRALAAVGVTRLEFLPPQPNPLREYVDQHLFLNIGPALARIRDIVQTHHIEALLAPAYEGGHPDHDTCAFLSCCISHKLVIPAWEFPLYHRDSNGEIERQRFLAREGGEVLFDATPAEIERKRRMLEAYVSQSDVIAQFNPAIERYRPQPAYDFSKPPHPGKLNYEAWGWPISGSQLLEAFAACEHCSPESEPDPKDPGTVVRGLV
jgi:LmbE family N-acetylglucosaminyl deacetylase